MALTLKTKIMIVVSSFLLSSEFFNYFFTVATCVWSFGKKWLPPIDLCLQKSMSGLFLATRSLIAHKISDYLHVFPSCLNLIFISPMTNAKFALIQQFPHIKKWIIAISGQKLCDHLLAIFLEVKANHKFRVRENNNSNLWMSLSRGSSDEVDNEANKSSHSKS